MSIIYALVGKDGAILAEHTNSTGNFPVIASQVLKACDNRKYMKYAASGYMFYVLNVQCTFMVMCDKSYSQRIAFSFLQTIRKMFMSAYNEQKINNAKAYDLMSFAPILKAQVTLYNEPQQVDKVARLLKETEEVSKIIEEDLQKILNRGQKLQVLVKKTQTMSSLSLQLKSSARTVRNQMFWHNMKMRILLALVIVVVIYLLLVSGCGGFTLSGCF